MAPNFSTILDTESEIIEKPKPLPVGSYLALVIGQPRFDKSSKKGTPFVEFQLALKQALDDVDEDDLEEVGGINGRALPITFYYKDDDATSLWRLKEFLDNCGVKEGGTIKSRIEDAVNSSVIVKITHQASEDGNEVYARAGKTAAAD